MKKNIIGVSIAMLFAANGAFAQSMSGSSVELYGVLDASIGHVNRSLSADPNLPATVNPVTATGTAVNNSVTGMFNGAIQPSRWGIRGTEDLGGGWHAIFNLDSYINVNSGVLSNSAQALANNRNQVSGTVSTGSSLNGQLFNDQAWVGLRDDVLGKFTFGRQWTGMADTITAYDAVQNAQLFSPLGYSGTYGGGGGVTENKRQDSSIKYSNKIADFNFGGMYKLGGVAAHSSAMSGWGVWGGYDAAGFGIQAVYQSFTDAIREINDPTIADTVNVRNFNTRSWLIAGKYAWGNAKVVAGYESYTLKNPSDSVNAISSGSINGFPIGNIPLTGVCGLGNTADSCVSDQTTRIYWIGADYNFTQAFNLAGGFYNVSPRRSDDAAQLKGNAYYYSLLADYHFTKRTDTYAGIMYSRFNGDQFPSRTTNRSNLVYAVGMRTKF